LATLPLNNVISGASKVIGEVLSNNKSTKQPVKLTQKQQVELFLKMPDSSLEAIRVKRGDAEYQRYMQHMLELSRGFYAK
jgi:hypothetical protein